MSKNTNNSSIKGVVITLLVLLLGAGAYTYFNTSEPVETIEVIDSTGLETDTLIIDSLSQDSID